MDPREKYLAVSLKFLSEGIYDEKMAALRIDVKHLLLIGFNVGPAGDAFLFRSSIQSE